MKHINSVICTTFFRLSEDILRLSEEGLIYISIWCDSTVKDATGHAMPCFRSEKPGWLDFFDKYAARINSTSWGQLGVRKAAVDGK